MNSISPTLQHQSRRERHALESRQRTLDRQLAAPRGKSKRLKLKPFFASVAATLLLASYALPAYAEFTPEVATTSAARDADSQSLSVPADALVVGTTRDQYLVTKTTLAGYQPYEHLADTFANNPTSAVQWPFSVGVPISSWFGFRSCEGCSTNHQGIDFNPGEGTPIEAIADGVVTEVGNPNGSFGVYAKISHQIDGQNVTSLYAHMLEDSLALAVGDKVTKGQLVGQVGSTGQSTGPHLHFGIYLNGATAIDPYPWMKEKVGS